MKNKWEPEAGDPYWTIDLQFGTLGVEVYEWEESDTDRMAMGLGNCFRTKALALKARGGIARLLKGGGR